jgi:hypothetical protein
LLILEKFSGLSARDNIGLGSSERCHDFDAIKATAKETGAHDCVAALSSYYLSTLTEMYSNLNFVPGMPMPGQFVPMPYYPDPNEVEWPFTVKVLSGDPYRQSKARGKTLQFYTKPRVPDETEISGKHPSMSPQPELVGNYGLSGGEWQRIALARSFMKIREADLFILDEPSSALDPQAEYEVFKTLLSMRQNKTTIYIVPTPSFSLS